MAVDWNSDEMSVWKEGATNKQQAYFNFDGGHKWKEYNQSDYNNLRRNIGYSIFGNPEKEPEEINDYTGYNRRQLSCIKTVFDVIKNYERKCKNKEFIYVRFICICAKIGDNDKEFFVIGVCKYNSPIRYETVFIDSCARVYKNWQDYLENNKLPECALCYPRNGIYSTVDGQVQVEFGISPAGEISSKVLEGLDITGGILGLGASGIAITSSFVPVAFPFLLGAGVICASTALYSSGRSIQTLVDRSEHLQSIGLDNSESRNCWLGIAGSAAALASGGAVAAASKMAQAGETISMAGQIALKLITTGSAFGNALGVVNGLTNIIEKVVREEEVTSLDVFQFMSSVLFFTSSVISTHQAHSLIRSIQRNGTGGSIPIHGSLNNYFIGCRSTLVSHVEESVSGIWKWVGRELSAITNMLLTGLMAVKEYVGKASDLLHILWLKLNEQKYVILAMICQEFGVKNWTDIVVGGRKILQGTGKGYMRKLCDTVIDETRSLGNWETAVRPPEQNQVTSKGNDIGTNTIVHEETHTALAHDIINIHARFVDIQKVKTAAEFYEYMKFTCKFVKNEFEKEKLKYEETLKMVQKFAPHVNIKDFDKQYGISGDRNNHFSQQVLNKFKPGKLEGLFSLKMAYDKQKGVTSAQEKSGGNFFETNESTFHTFGNKAGLADNGMLSEDQYYKIAAELTKQHADKENVSFTVKGNTAIMLVNKGKFVITVNSYLEDGKVSGIAAMLHSPHSGDN